MSLRNLFRYDISPRQQNHCADEYLLSQCVLELLHDSPQLAAGALRTLVLHCNVERLLRYVSVPSARLVDATHLNLFRERVQVIAELRSILLL